MWTATRFRPGLEVTGVTDELLSLKVGEIDARVHDLDPAGSIPADLPAFCQVIVDQFAATPAR